MCRLFELIDVDLTVSDAKLAFVWARMRVVDEQTDRGNIKLTHLNFEDWLEGTQPGVRARDLSSIRGG